MPSLMSKEENMAKDAIVSDDLAKKFATEKDTPYLRWVSFCKFNTCASSFPGLKAKALLV